MGDNTHLLIKMIYSYICFLVMIDNGVNEPSEKMLVVSDICGMNAYSIFCSSKWK